MSLYKGYKCAACGNVFDENDDVVVCPECGAPHHRSCYLEKGQCALGVYYAGDAVTMMQNNEDLDFVVPKEGSNMFVDSLVIPKNAKNKEGAELFINFLLDPEVSAANAEFVCYTSCNKASYSIIEPDIMENKIIYPDDEVYERCFYFSNMEKDLYDYMQKEWIIVKK